MKNAIGKEREKSCRRSGARDTKAERFNDMGKRRDKGKVKEIIQKKRRKGNETGKEAIF